MDRNHVLKTSDLLRLMLNRRCYGGCVNNWWIFRKYPVNQPGYNEGWLWCRCGGCHRNHSLREPDYSLWDCGNL